MKLLLDENFPQKVLVDFPEHSVTTVEKAGWKGKKNGELLGLMRGEIREEEGLEKRREEGWGRRDEG